MPRNDETPAIDQNAFAAAIGAAVAQGIAAMTPAKEIKEGDPEYTARLHAEGFYDEFERPVYQNGYQAQARGLPAETRERASRLKPGHYLKGRVRVDVDGHGGVYLNYPTK